ncbi:MAG: hypothetical protein AAF791_03565, partial [Bacteroidota bacterium]
VWEYDTGLRYVFSDPFWSGEYAVYSPSALAFSASPNADADDYISQDEDLQRDLPDVSQYAPPDPLEVMLDVVAFRGDDGQTDLVIASEVSVPDDLREMRSGAWILRDGREESAREDQNPTLVPLVSLPSGRVWTRAAQFATTPGDVDVHTEAADVNDGAAGWARETVRVPAWPPGMQLSGLLLVRGLDDGRPAGPGEIARRGTVMQPAASATFGATDPVGVYAEVYGLSADTGEARYAVQAALVPVDGRPGIIRAIGGLFGRGRRRGVSVEVEETTRGATASVALLLDASRQSAGVYTLTLTVTDRATGEAVETLREVTLL